MPRRVDGPEITGQVFHKQTGQAYGPVTVTASPKVYTDPEMSAAVTTLTSDGTGVFSCYAPPGTYTFTTAAVDAATIEPVEVLGREGGTGTPQSAAYVAVLGASNGADDTAWLNTALAAGGRFRGTPGQNYLLTDVLVLPSYTELDMTGCTVTEKTGSGKRMVKNLNHDTAALRSVADAGITTGLAVLTSATAAFTAADVGRSVSIAGATSSGEQLNARIKSVTNATTAVLNTTAGTTVAAAALSIFEVDLNISVIGGIWDRGSNVGATFKDTNSLSFQRVTNLKVRDVDGRSGGGSRVFAGIDLIRASFRDLTGTASAVLLQLQGPIVDVLIDNVTGTSGSDDFVAIGGREYSGNEWLAGGGSLKNVTISNIRPASAGVNVVHVFGGRGVTVRDVTVQNVSGTSVAGNGVALTDDTTNAFTTGQNIDGIIVRNVDVALAAAFSNVALGGANIGTIVVDGVTVSDRTGNAANGILVGSNANAVALLASNLAHSGSLQHAIVRVASGAVIGTLMVDKVKATGSNARAITLTASPTHTELSNFDIASIGNFVYADTTAALFLEMSNIRVAGTPNAYLLTGNAAHTVLASNVKGETLSNGFFVNNSVSGTLDLTISGYKAISGALLSFRTSTQTTRVTGHTAPVDVATLTPNDGDLVYNTNAGALCGIGVVVYNTAAAKWKNIYTEVTT